MANPNVRGADAEGNGGHVDPIADWWDMATSNYGLGLLVGADVLVNDAGLLGAGADLIGVAADGVGGLL